MIHKDTYNKDIEFVGSKGIAFIEHKMLVYRRDGNTDHCPHMIDLPGGGREGKESPFETFKRECNEEFGINVTEDDVAKSFIYPSHKGGISFFFITKDLPYTSRDIILGDEGEEWMLMTIDEFIKRPDGIKRQQERIKRYIIEKSCAESESFKLAHKLLGKEVEIVIDRKLGTKHPKHNFTYKVNYGYVEDIMAPDGEELDAYLLGVDKPVEKARGVVRAIVHRLYDDDDKLIVVPNGISVSDQDIEQSVSFQEQWFSHCVIQ